MANVERNVNGENLSRREFLKKTAAGAMLLNLGLSAFADKPDFNIPSPLEHQMPRHPITDTDTELPQPTSEHFRLEETDPFSEEGKLKNFIADYVLATEKEKREIKQRVFTHESGATIYVSKNTTATLGQPQSALLPFEKIAYGEEKHSDIFTRIPAEYLPELSTNAFAVVDINKSNDCRVIVWTTLPVTDPPTENHINSIEDLSTRAWYRFTAFPKGKCVLWENGQPIPVLPYPVDPNSSIFGLHGFWDRPVWLEDKDQLAVVRGQEVAALYDPGGVTYPSGNLQLNVVEEFDPSLMLGTREAKLKQTLKNCLLILPEIFTDKEEVVEYLRSGDASRLKNVKLLPPENPGIFVICNGRFGVKNPVLMKGFDEASKILERVDEHAIDNLNFLGAIGITTSLRESTDFNNPKNLCYGAVATFDTRFGITIINEPIAMTYTRTRFENPLRLLTKELVFIVLNEAYHMKFLHEQSLIADKPKERSSSNVLKVSLEGGLVKSDKTIAFTLKYKAKLGEEIAHYLVEHAGAIKESYLADIKNIDDIMKRTANQ